MKNVNFILNKLEQKKDLFLIYEEVTKEIYDSDFEKMEEINLKRFAVSNEINVLDSEVLNFYINRDDSDLIRSALRNKCNRSELPENLQIIFDEAQEIFCVIKRIQTLEMLIMERLIAHKLEIEKKIKESNASPKITQYLNAVGGNVATGVLYGSKI